MDSDRVLVMSLGEVAEYDTPEKLLENPVSDFYLLNGRGGEVYSLDGGKGASTERRVEKGRGGKG